MREVESKYITFRALQRPGEAHKPSLWAVVNRRSHHQIGRIAWYASWRRYCFMPEANTVFDVECLERIHQFIAELKEPMIFKIGKANVGREW